MDTFLIISVLFTINLRWLISRFSYSGENKPIIYGDYEAQRHWMEITYNLAPNNWYRNSIQNDLQYWGLDYPPLTGYHSYLNGLISHKINPEWVKLFKSRGFESYYHKIFMRSTVLISDIIIFYTSIIYFWIKCTNNLSYREKYIYIFLSLLYPGLILIDHGHFQYNCISLGLTIWAICFLKKNKIYYGSFFFCLALNYKQMSLYYACPFFFYLFGLTLKKPTIVKKIQTLILLILIVCITFYAIWFPFLDDFGKSVLLRIFPIKRGLFEDKVANIWCILDVLFKLKKNLLEEKLVLISLLSTILLLIPSSINLFLKPSFERFKYSLVNSSLIFYLASYHVHEKQILLPATVILLIFDQELYAGFLFFIISTYSLFPLLMKDELSLPYFILLLLFTLIIYTLKTELNNFELNNFELNKFTNFYIFKFFYICAILGCLILSLVQLLFKPPLKYPDIYTLINAVYSCGSFSLFLIYFHYKQFKLSTVLYKNINLYKQKIQ